MQKKAPETTWHPRRLPTSPPRWRSRKGDRCLLAARRNVGTTSRAPADRLADRTADRMAMPQRITWRGHGGSQSGSKAAVQQEGPGIGGRNAQRIGECGTSAPGCPGPVRVMSAERCTAQSTKRERIVGNAALPKRLTAQPLRDRDERTRRVTRVPYRVAAPDPHAFSATAGPVAPLTRRR